MRCGFNSWFMVFLFFFVGIEFIGNMVKKRVEFIVEIRSVG